MNELELVMNELELGSSSLELGSFTPLEAGKKKNQTNIQALQLQERDKIYFFSKKMCRIGVVFDAQKNKKPDSSSF
jgi:hypothetical protein